MVARPLHLIMQDKMKNWGMGRVSVCPRQVPESTSLTFLIYFSRCVDKTVVFYSMRIAKSWFISKREHRMYRVFNYLRWLGRTTEFQKWRLHAKQPLWYIRRNGTPNDMICFTIYEKLVLVQARFKMKIWKQVLWENGVRLKTIAGAHYWLNW